jgi:hypothetical protein
MARTAETESAVARMRWKVVVIIGCSEGFILSGPKSKAAFMGTSNWQTSRTGERMTFAL